MIVPDPLRFTRRALEALGGLVDPDDAGLVALLPAGEARDLGVPESVEIGAFGDDGRVPCGIGSPLLEKLVERARGEVAVASIRTAARPPTEAQARSLAAGFPLRNGVHTVGTVTMSEALYARVAFAWRLEADEKHEGLARATVCLADGACPPEDAARSWESDLGEAEAVSVPAPDPAGADWFARLVPRSVEPAVAPLLALVARRQQREHARLVDYYGALAAETARPKRRVDPAAVRAKLDHVIAERDSRLADLAHRYGAKVDVAIAGVLFVRVPVASVSLMARRRKGQRTLALRLAAGARAFDRLPCDACDAWTDRPALCDDRLHVLCEACVPEATGRPKCGACGGD